MAQKMDELIEGGINERDQLYRDIEQKDQRIAALEEKLETTTHALSKIKEWTGVSRPHEKPEAGEIWCACDKSLKEIVNE